MPLTQDIVTNSITERMDALRNDLDSEFRRTFGCAVAFCGRVGISPITGRVLNG